MNATTQSKPSTKKSSTTDGSEEDLKHGVQNLVEGAKEYVSQTATSMADSARRQATETRKRIVNVGEDSQDFAAQEYHRCVDSIRHNPLTAIGIASLVGIAIGVGLTLQGSRRN